MSTALLADGGPARDLTADEVRAHLATLVERSLADAHRVLLVPPDHTRLHSQAGWITVELMAMLRGRGCEVGVLPALGTHVAMGERETAAMFGDALATADLIVHDWRDGLVRVGEIAADEVASATGGRFADPLEVAIDGELFAGWDRVVSIGQVVPHEVIGMANFTKNLVIGLGGAPTIHHTHFVGAIVGMESIMGRPGGPVRDLVDAAFDRFLAPEIDVLWLLTVVEDLGDRVAVRGLFAGEGGTSASGGAAYRAAAALSVLVNLDLLDAPVARAACWLDPAEFHSTWLGNKAIYRTRMAMADGGELIVLAPGVRRFGEDDRVDELIRRHGYRGTAATLAAVATDADLARNLSAAAHLVHGSSEGRFAITYCTDPDAGGLTRDEVESVGFGWRPLGPELARLGVAPTTPSGASTGADGAPLYFVANPALGLWSTRERFAEPASG